MERLRWIQTAPLCTFPTPVSMVKNQFTYQISDGELASEVVTVTLTVISTNTPPVANDDAFSGQPSGARLKRPRLACWRNDTDDDGQVLVAVLETEPSQGSLEFAGDGSFRYISKSEFTGEDQFTYRASDGESTSELSTVTITVAQVNSAPVAMDDYYEIAEDETLNVDPPGILENDHDPDGQSLQMNPRGGTALRKVRLA